MRWLRRLLQTPPFSDRARPCVCFALQLRTIVLINCAGTFDVTTIFNQDADDDLCCYILDSHRPIHLSNIYENQGKVSFVVACRFACVLVVCAACLRVLPRCARALACEEIFRPAPTATPLPAHDRLRVCGVCVCSCAGLRSGRHNRHDPE